MRIAPPLYSTVSELHDDLVKHARDALVTALDGPGVREEESIGGDPAIVINETRLAAAFREAAKERMAQVAGAVWMEAECDREDAYRAGIEFVLKTLEAGPPREVALGSPAASAAVTAILRGTAMGIRETITRDMVRELAKRLR